MIGHLNELVDAAEREPYDVDVAALARRVGSTEFHLRRMFSALAGMGVAEYVRRRRMTRAAQDLLATSDDLLTIAVRHGYSSTEAFTRAFRSVHGASPSEVRRDGGPVRAQAPLRFRVRLEGNTPMHTRLVQRDAFTLAGHAIRVPLQHHGVNPAIAEFVTSLPVSEHARLKALSSAEPAGLLQVTDGVAQAAEEGAEVRYLHGVAVAPGASPEDLDTIEAPAGTWAVFTSSGPHPHALQDTWAATAAEWFPSQPWRLRPGPSLVAILKHADDFATATCELWLPVEDAG